MGGKGSQACTWCSALFIHPYRTLIHPYRTLAIFIGFCGSPSPSGWALRDSAFALSNLGCYERCSFNRTPTGIFLTSPAFHDRPPLGKSSNAPTVANVMNVHVVSWQKEPVADVSWRKRKNAIMEDETKLWTNGGREELQRPRVVARIIAYHKWCSSHSQEPRWRHTIRRAPLRGSHTRASSGFAWYPPPALSPLMGDAAPSLTCCSRNDTHE